MKIQFYNPKKLDIPMKLSLIIDDKYIVDYERDYNVKSRHHLCYTFTMYLKDNILKIDDIQQIMMEISKIIIDQYLNDDIELDLNDFSIEEVNTHKCIYKLTFYKY